MSQICDILSNIPIGYSNVCLRLYSKSSFPITGIANCSLLQCFEMFLLLFSVGFQIHFPKANPLCGTLWLKSRLINLCLSYSIGRTKVHMCYRRFYHNRKLKVFASFYATRFSRKPEKASFYWQSHLKANM